jgi:serine phosphatase RsbU (regulator of sigma subunit)
VFFAVADCTGHGVPGAMVSVICNNGLNRAVREYGLSDPGKILDKTREIVIEEFEKSNDDVKDGMDIALCSLENNVLEYAGAHNPLWLIRNNELMTIKANKQPIGKFDLQEPYTTHRIELKKGDALYLFSDGYIDQFGGEKGKKLKTSGFKDLLLNIQSKVMKEQYKIIKDNFYEWKGNIEQIDDICIMGIKF